MDVRRKFITYFVSVSISVQLPSCFSFIEFSCFACVHNQFNCLVESKQLKMVCQQSECIKDESIIKHWPFLAPT